MEKEIIKTYKVFKTKNGYKLSWFASRITDWTGGHGAIDENGNSRAVESTVRVKGVCECKLLSNETFGITERNLIKKAIHSALYALDLETFLYNDKQRNTFIDYVLNGKISIIKLDTTDAWIQLDFSEYNEETYALTTIPYQKRHLIKDGEKIEDLIDENYGRKYAFFTDIEIIEE